MIQISIGSHIDKVGKIDIDKNLLEEIAQMVLMEEGEEASELSLYLTDDNEIKYLNKVYRNFDEPTDVLAFSMREGVKIGVRGQGSGVREKKTENRKQKTENRKEKEKREDRILGDVIISVETAQRQAQEVKRSLKDELNHLLVHGLLHLLGYNHKGKSDTELMRKREKEILDKCEVRSAKYKNKNHLLYFALRTSHFLHIGA